jgi:hypothetical protein
MRNPDTDLAWTILRVYQKQIPAQYRELHFRVVDIRIPIKYRLEHAISHRLPPSGSDRFRPAYQTLRVVRRSSETNVAWTILRVYQTPIQNYYIYV